MATAYTPGLAVSRYTHLRKMRRLPLAGNVIVDVGQHVDPDDILARAELPGIMRTVRAAEILGIDPKEIKQYLQIEEGQQVSRGDILARSTSFWGLFKTECKSPVNGTLELINPISGNLGIREAPLPVEITAYLKGTVTEVIQGEGAIVETHGALIQGIFGIGGEKSGTIRRIASSPEDTITASDIPSDVHGQVLIGGACADLSALQAAGEAGAVGFVVGGVVDSDLVAYLGHDIGVAITGEEPVPTTVILTEGFGQLAMAHRTWELFSELEGQSASINGATQIRAGVIRPEVIVPDVSLESKQETDREAGVLEKGSPIRLIRDPYFGMLGVVEELPADLQTVPSGAKVRVLVARLSDGRVVTAPRANVELIEQ